ncbi:MAG: hypothetical protein QOD48_249, partial [Gaiellaceae bacterium]|nr:hypothetical protein [Gaiellaceae bacterium]
LQYLLPEEALAVARWLAALLADSCAAVLQGVCSGPAWIRTRDQRIMSPLL